MKKLFLILDGNFEDFAKIQNEIPKDIELFESKKSDASKFFIEALVTLSTISIPYLAEIIIEKIKSNKHIELKYEGLEVKGISEDNVMEILDKLLNND